jgi:hypothetical protein
LQHRNLPAADALQALVKAQLQTSYADAFIRLTGGDSLTQDFTPDFIHDATILFEPVPSRLEYAKIFLKAINTGVIADRTACLLTIGTDKIGTGKLLEVPAHLLSHYRPILYRVAENPLVISPLTCVRLTASLAGKIIALPVPGGGVNGGLAISWRVAAANIETAFDYAALLLISDFAFQLRRCKLASCHELFLVERGKKETQRKYCSDEHRAEYLKADGKQRTYAARVGVTTNEWRAIIKRGPGLTPSKYRAQHKSVRRNKQRK